MSSPLKYLFSLYAEANDEQRLATVQAADDIANGREWSKATEHHLSQAFANSGWMFTLDFQEVQDMMKEKAK